MSNPLITARAGEYLLIGRKNRCLSLQIGRDRAIGCLVCHFLDGADSLRACVMAPEQEQALLIHRAVSFLGAYLRIDDRDSLEWEILRCVEDCLRKHPL